ncbi:hypothetical protein, partial [Klebsiella quasipneumoniae]|uniref:hypothetical protein n=1 Tax=Klebsiella quasipneumoniae TaxID=1463165 RepID=UPI001F172644
NRSHWSTSKTPSYTKSVSWHHYPIAPYYGTDKNNPRRTCIRHRPLFSYQDLRPHECDNH